MAFLSPRDILIECGACGIENHIKDFTPEMVVVCNQCRDRLITPDLAGTHLEYVCEDCELTFLLTRDNEIVPGESACRCGSTNLSLMESPLIAELAEEAQSLGSPEEEDAEDFDWCRSSPDENISDDYNELFDNDPAQ